MPVTKITLSTAMRARDVSRPRTQQLAEAAGAEDAAGRHAHEPPQDAAPRHQVPRDPAPPDQSPPAEQPAPTEPFSSPPPSRRRRRRSR